MAKTRTLSEADQIELRWKELQSEDLAERIAERKQKKDQLATTRARQVEDFKKGERERLRRQTNCKHRKGGKDNRFAQGNSQNYSVNLNTYPDGRQVIFCTRCGKEVERPRPELRKKDPELYAKMWAEWKEWNSFPTDNSPSGGKIFEVTPAVAA
jgi:hypothetical protein